MIRRPQPETVLGLGAVELDEGDVALEGVSNKGIRVEGGAEGSSEEKTGSEREGFTGKGMVALGLGWKYAVSVWIWPMKMLRVSTNWY